MTIILSFYYPAFFHGLLRHKGAVLDKKLEASTLVFVCLIYFFQPVCWPKLASRALDQMPLDLSNLTSPGGLLDYRKGLKY